MNLYRSKSPIVTRTMAPSTSGGRRPKRTLRAWVAIAVVVLVGGLTAVALSSSPASATDYFTWKNSGSGKCIDVTDWSYAEHARLQQWDCSGYNNQLWYYRASKAGYWQMASKFNGMCIAVNVGGDGAALVQRTCDYYSDLQFWGFTQTRDSWGRTVWLIKNKYTGKCIDVTSWSTSNGTKLQDWGCKYDWNQYWI